MKNEDEDPVSEEEEQLEDEDDEEDEEDEEEELEGEEKKFLFLKAGDSCPKCPEGELEKLGLTDQLRCDECEVIFHHPDQMNAEEQGVARRLEEDVIAGIVRSVAFRVNEDLLDTLYEEKHTLEKLGAVVAKTIKIPRHTVNHAPVIVKTPTPALSGGSKAFIVICMIIMLVVPWALANAVFRQPAPVVNVAAPEVTINGSDIVDSLMTRRMDFDERTGLYIPLPAEADNPAQFRAACREVCAGHVRWTTRYPRGRDQERVPVPENPVLVNDPEHQICVCFSGDRVVRHVGWNTR